MFRVESFPPSSKPIFKKQFLFVETCMHACVSMHRIYGLRIHGQAPELLHLGARLELNPNKPHEKNLPKAI